VPIAANARSRVRAELTREIAGAARLELAEVGAAALSLRAVARRLGMAPSALYRYYDSRDHLLTVLIIEAYEAVGDAAVAADGAEAPGDFALRWMAVSRAVRRWSAAHPHEWALVFGSPVPGYEGSERTSEAAMRLHRVPFDLVAAAHRAGAVAAVAPAGTTAQPALGAALAPLLDFAPELPAQVAAATLDAWVQVIGAISLERFGHFRGVIDDLDAWFARTAAVAAGLAGIEVRGDPGYGGQVPSTPAHAPGDLFP
jgi:AcrR family transcriptional regulator